MIRAASLRRFASLDTKPPKLKIIRPYVSAKRYSRLNAAVVFRRAFMKFKQECLRQKQFDTDSKHKETLKLLGRFYKFVERHFKHDSAFSACVAKTAGVSFPLSLFSLRKTLAEFGVCVADDLSVGVSYRDEATVVKSRVFSLVFVGDRTKADGFLDPAADRVFLNITNAIRHVLRIFALEPEKSILFGQARQIFDPEELLLYFLNLQLHSFAVHEAAHIIFDATGILPKVDSEELAFIVEIVYTDPFLSAYTVNPYPIISSSVISSSHIHGTALTNIEAEIRNRLSRDAFHIFLLPNTALGILEDKFHPFYRIFVSNRDLFDSIGLSRFVDENDLPFIRAIIEYSKSK